MLRTTVLVGLLVAGTFGCDGRIYLRDGVTDGDTFYLSQQALVDDDPVLQSWVRYSLVRSTCQLQSDSENPARATSYECELRARESLLEAWREHKARDPLAADTYLDEFLLVQYEGYLGEYVATHLRRRHWSVPRDLKLRDYRRWHRKSIPTHEPETRITGTWNYASVVSAP